MRTKSMITYREWRRFLAAIPLRLLLLATFPTLALLSYSKEDIGTDNTEKGATSTTDGIIMSDISFAPTTRVATANDFKSYWEGDDEVGISPNK